MMTRMEQILKLGMRLLVLISTSNLMFAQDYQNDNLVIKLASNQRVVKSVRPEITRDITRYKYGIPALDSLLQNHKVIRLEKMFVDEVDNELSRYFRVWLNAPSSDITALATAFQALDAVEMVELQVKGELLDQNHPNDPLYNFSLNGGSGDQEQWYLYNDGDMDDDETPDGTVRADIYAPEAWDIQTGRSDVILSYTDSGVLWSHEDLRANLWVNPEEDGNGNGIFDWWPIQYGGDFGDVNSDGCPGDCDVDDDGDGYVDFNDPAVYEIFTNGLDDDGDGTIEDELYGDDDDSPGTLGVDDDGDGVIDDYDGAIFDDDENGFADDVIGWDFYNWDWGPQDDLGHGVAMASDMAAVGNNEKGVTGVTWGCKLMVVKIISAQKDFDRIEEGVYYTARNGAHVHNMSWKAAISSTILDELYDNYNMVVVAAAGNHNENPPIWPARYEKVIAVAGLNSYDEKLHVNSDTGSSYGPQIELCAAMAPITHAGNWNNSHYRFDGWGTSHSSPIVAGVAALVISELIDQGVTDYTNDLVRSILTYTADDVDYANEGQPWEGLLGTGRINAYRAVLSAKYDIQQWLTGTVSGTISQNTLLYGDVNVPANIVVNSGVNLVVEAGTNVSFASVEKLQINGKLIAEGTSSNRITFTKSGSSPWGGIHLFGSHNRLKYCDIEYGSSYNLELRGTPTQGTDNRVEYCTVKYCDDGPGITIINNDNPKILHCRDISYNAEAGIDIDNTEWVELEDTWVMYNEEDGIYSSHSDMLFDGCLFKENDDKGIQSNRDDFLDFSWDDPWGGGNSIHDNADRGLYVYDYGSSSI